MPSLAASAILFLGLMAVCFGLGYPAMCRYVPWQAGNRDAWVYHRMILGEPVNAPLAYRVLVPGIARGVLAGVSRLGLGTWDPVWVSLLAVNAALVSLTALVLMRIAAAGGRDGRPDLAVAALVPWVYLSSFVVVNFHLAGLIDAAEGFFLAAVLLALLHGRWAWLPPLVALGVLGKETVLPFAAAGMAAVWIGDWIRGEKHLARRTLWCAVTLAAGLVSLAVCRGLVHVPPYEPHTLSWSRLAAFPANLAACVFERTNLYSFLFLLPMGLMRIRQIPGRLLTASLAMALAATVLGAYADIHGNMQRPWFNTLGPMLVIASSIFLRDLTRNATGSVAAGE